MQHAQLNTDYTAHLVIARVRRYGDQGAFYKHTFRIKVKHPMRSTIEDAVIRELVAIGEEVDHIIDIR